MLHAPTNTPSPWESHSLGTGCKGVQECWFGVRNDLSLLPSAISSLLFSLFPVSNLRPNGSEPPLVRTRQHSRLPIAQTPTESSVSEALSVCNITTSACEPYHKYSQHRLISPRLIEHSRNITNFLGTGRPH